MDLVERYLSAVSLLLPAAGRADILAELRDVLMSRREEKAAELGRPLTRAEDEALLKAFGHPLTVAGRYGRQQYLVGPELFPLFSLVLKIVLAIIAGSAVISAIVNSVLQPADPGPAIAAAVGVLWTGGWAALGAVTFVFWTMQRSSVRLRFLERWSVSELPHIARPRRRRAAWFEHVVAIVAQAIFLLWWMGVIQLWPSHLPLKAGQSLDVTLGPVWAGLHWPVIALSFAVIAVHAVRLAEVTPRLGLALDLVLQVALLALGAYLLRAGGWVSVVGQGLPAAALAKIRDGVDVGMQVTLIVIVVVAAARALSDVWRLVRPAGPAAAA